MFMWFARIFIIIMGPIIGYFSIAQGPKGILIGTSSALLVIFIEWALEKAPLDDIIAAGMGIIIGLIAIKTLDYLVMMTFADKTMAVWNKYSLLLKITAAYTGMLIAVKKKSEMYLLDKSISFTSKKMIPESIIVDSCVLIDGRIADIAKAGFMNRMTVIPRFVINELQTLADSSDDSKRVRGKRGLQTITFLEKEDSGVRVKIYEKDYADLNTTDEKLLKCTADLRAKLMTSDTNLAQVAGIRGIGVLNVNMLAKSLKPVVLPGEALDIFLLKEGKEHRQAVGYLDDGTMIVVDNARRFIGQKKKIIVVSFLQTDAGRMIFAKLDSNA
ncbi:MAG: hypothetical protein U9O97_02135 [Elusimicrobiota bacterium]|nr:hypothetical protein [Elusimicrobiota bacterium]